jgi:hypothetical protein
MAVEPEGPQPNSDMDTILSQFVHLSFSHIPLIPIFILSFHLPWGIPNKSCIYILFPRLVLYIQPLAPFLSYFTATVLKTTGDKQISTFAHSPDFPSRLKRFTDQFEVFWVVRPFGVMVGCQRFEGAYCLHLLEVCSSETSVSYGITMRWPRLGLEIYFCWYKRIERCGPMIIILLRIQEVPGSNSILQLGFSSFSSVPLVKCWHNTLK